MWAAKDRQSALHPPVSSWGLGTGFTQEFDIVGTHDPTTYLAAPVGVAFMRELGIDAMRRYNHALAWDASRLLTDRWGTSGWAPEDMIGVMATVPLPARLGSTSGEASLLRDALLFEDRIEVQLHAWRGQLWVRVSAQVYNDITDVERLAEAVLDRSRP